ncbi:MAG TPA: universal stress protein [Acidimicrobiales bacterium]|nr:universal stress protein [Acidimicrobiales bacterium]
MFGAIVVPLDGSEHTEVALHPAFSIASQTGAYVVLLSVVQPDFVQERGDYLRGWARSAFIPCEVAVATEGSVPDNIITLASANEPSLVCMASHGFGFFGQALFGTVCAEVVRGIGAPVLVVGPHARTDVTAYTDVIAAVDASSESARVMEPAVALARALDAKLEIVQVIHPDDVRQAQASDVAGSDVRETGHVAMLAAKLGDDLAASWEVLHNDDPARGIVDYVRARPSAIIAMATHARAGLDLLAEGSVATHVVHAAENPVLLLH